MKDKFKPGDFDLELPVLPPEFGEPPRLSFHEHLRFCGEYRDRPRLVPPTPYLEQAPPVSEEFVL